MADINLEFKPCRECGQPYGGVFPDGLHVECRQRRKEASMSPLSSLNCQTCGGDLIGPTGPTGTHVCPVGVKGDVGKLRWSLLPDGVVREVVKVLEFGAKKYQVDNWQKVPEPRTRYYDALIRHVEAWWLGERKDPESGCHHLAHAVCCGFFLMWFDENGVSKVAK